MKVPSGGGRDWRQEKCWRRWRLRTERYLAVLGVDLAAKAVAAIVFEGLPEEAFRRDVSSTEIRDGWGDGDAAS